MQRISAVSQTERIERTGWSGGLTISSEIRELGIWSEGNVFRENEEEEQVTDKISHVSITLSGWWCWRQGRCHMYVCHP